MSISIIVANLQSQTPLATVGVLPPLVGDGDRYFLENRDAERLYFELIGNKLRLREVEENNGYTDIVFDSDTLRFSGSNKTGGSFSSHLQSSYVVIYESSVGTQSSLTFIVKYGSGASNLFDDIYWQGNENDNVVGSSLKDLIIGESGNDELHGGAGNDLLLGGGGNDNIKGGGGDDRLRGNGGDDTLKGGGGDDNIKGGGGSDNIKGNGGSDAIKAGGGADTVKGGGGADVINGGGGDDVLQGGGGNDTITGKGGDDTLKGNGGADVFQFRASDRNDTILDFRQGQDLIEIQNGANSFAALDIEQDGQDVLIGFGTGQVRVVTDSVGAFDENDFIF